MIDFKKSKGNYFVDIDGNAVLDLNGMVSNNPIGYNHNNMIKAAKTKAFDKYLINTTTGSAFSAPEDFDALIDESLMPVAPKGLKEVLLTTDAGDGANEYAFKLAFMRHRRN
jgi:4-aminobutyrate aminotransferase/(S)-3-amino-2-methylpropionate transaminase